MALHRNVDPSALCLAASLPSRVLYFGAVSTPIWGNGGS